MMGTRPGALDAGVLLHLLKGMEMKLTEVERLIYLQSGLKGVSGLSDNMRILVADGTPAACEAVELYCYLAAKQIASLLPALGGMEAIIFTGGIGENVASVRDAITTQLEWLGDFPVFVVPTDEELVIAAACHERI